jgi:broad specificity phosphatase PhoE
MRRPLSLFFVRHGESEANLRHEFSNQGLRHPLTPTGRAQVDALATRLADRRVDRVYSSPILRASQSAELLSERLGVAFEVVEALREYDVGRFEGTTDAEHWAEYDRVVRGWLLEGDRELRTGGGESLTEIQARFGGFVRSLPGRWPEGGNLVLLSHGGLFRVALPDVLSNVGPRFAFEHVLDHVTWVQATFMNDGSLRCDEWAGTTPGEPPGSQVGDSAAATPP